MNKEIKKAFHILDLAHLEGSVSNDDISKARVTKYYRREGSPGKYKYYYTKAEWDKAKKGKDTGADVSVFTADDLANLENVKRAVAVASDEKLSISLKNLEQSNEKHKQSSSRRQNEYTQAQISIIKEELNKRGGESTDFSKVDDSNLDTMIDILSKTGGKRTESELKFLYDAVYEREKRKKGVDKITWIEEWVDEDTGGVIAEKHSGEYVGHEELNNMRNEYDETYSEYKKLRSEERSKLDKWTEDRYDLRNMVEAYKYDLNGLDNRINQINAEMEANAPEGGSDEFAEKWTSQVADLDMQRQEAESNLINAQKQLEEHEGKHPETSESKTDLIESLEKKTWVLREKISKQDKLRKIARVKDLLVGLVNDPPKGFHSDVESMFGVSGESGSELIEKIMSSHPISMVEDWVYEQNSKIRGEKGGDLRKSEYLEALQDLGLDIEKGRTKEGVYANTDENRKLGRVGQKYKKGDTEEKKEVKGHSKVEDIEAQIAQLEDFRKTEINKTGFVSGKTFNKLSKLKKELAAIKGSSPNSKTEDIKKPAEKNVDGGGSEKEESKPSDAPSKEDYKKVLDDFISGGGTYDQLAKIAQEKPELMKELFNLAKKSREAGAGKQDLMGILSKKYKVSEPKKLLGRDNQIKLEISSNDKVIFEKVGDGKFGVRLVQTHGYPVDYMKKKGFKETESFTAGVSEFIHSSGNYDPITFTEKEFSELVGIMDKGFNAAGKEFSDFYKDREKD